MLYCKLRISSLLYLGALVAVLAGCSAWAQQTLGGIVGTVTDTQGATLPGAKVVIVDQGTHLTRKTESSSVGLYSFPNLPIGTYLITFEHDGFSTEKFPGILVQADRTITLPASLKPGSVSDAVTVDATPLMNAVDTTNGYVLEKGQIASIPLPTGSFTGVAILSPGVNAELPGGTGSGTRPSGRTGNAIRAIPFC